MSNPTPDVETSGRSWLRSRYVVAAVIVVIALIFIFENTQRVHIRVLGPQIHARMWEALLATFILGMLSMWLLQRHRHKVHKAAQSAATYREP